MHTPSINNNQKNAMQAGGVLLLLFGIGYGLYKIFKPGAGSDTAKQDNTQSVQVQKASLTKQPAFYSNLADTIYDAFNKAITTDSSHFFFTGIDDSVIAPLKQLNSEEVKQVFKNFGTRSFSYIVKPFDRTNYNLRSFAQESLGAGDEYNKFNQILISAGI